MSVSIHTQDQLVILVVLGSPVYRVWLVLWRRAWRFLKKKRKKNKLGIKLPYDPAIPLLGIYPEETIIEKDIGTLMFIATLFIIASCLENLHGQRSLAGYSPCYHKESDTTE